jgi:hypothetical protein
MAFRLIDVATGDCTIDGRRRTKAEKQAWFKEQLELAMAISDILHEDWHTQEELKPCVDDLIPLEEEDKE